MPCGTCGNGHDNTTTQNFQRHEKAAAHKRRIDAQFAATEEAVFCGTCGSGQALQRHQSSMNTSAHAHSDIRAIYADTVELARLFKSISSIYTCMKQASYTYTRAHSDVRTVYADTVEHARLFKSISGVQRYSLQRSMRANMRSAPCLCAFHDNVRKRQAVHVRA